MPLGFAPAQRAIFVQCGPIDQQSAAAQPGARSRRPRPRARPKNRPASASAVRHSAGRGAECRPNPCCSTPVQRRLALSILALREQRRRALPLHYVDRRDWRLAHRPALTRRRLPRIFEARSCPNDRNRQFRQGRDHDRATRCGAAFETAGRGVSGSTTRTSDGVRRRERPVQRSDRVPNSGEDRGGSWLRCTRGAKAQRRASRRAHGRALGRLHALFQSPRAPSRDAQRSTPGFAQQVGEGQGRHTWSTPTRCLSCGDPDSLCDRFFKPFRDGIHFGPEGHQHPRPSAVSARRSRTVTPSAMPKRLE